MENEKRFDWLNNIVEQSKKQENFSKVDYAIYFATIAHAGQIRKGTTIPYIFHVLNVGKILAEDLQCEEDIVIAGILHDTLEDTKITKEDILKNFGENVLRLVVGNSERDKKDTWENRKKEAIEHAKKEAEDVLLIKLADKLDNIKAIERDYHYSGNEIWKRFNAPKDRLEWYYRSLRDIFAEKIYNMEYPERAKVLFEYEQCLDEVFKK